MTITEVIEQITRIGNGGDKVRLGWSYNGQSHKDAKPVSPAEAEAAARTIYNIGGEVSSVYRHEGL